MLGSPGWASAGVPSELQTGEEQTTCCSPCEDRVSELDLLYGPQTSHSMQPSLGLCISHKSHPGLPISSEGVRK